jgi:hypothetical protein
MKKHHLILLASLFSIFVLISCAPSTHQVLATGESQLKLRSIQSRAFDTTDINKMLRTTIATLQDLGFIIDKADVNLGTVSATKLEKYNLRMTVTVRPRGESQLVVRANAQYNITAVEDPEPYQQFFNSLSKAMFLTAHEVD